MRSADDGRRAPTQATLLGAGGLFNGYFMNEDGKSATKKPVFVWFDDYPSAKTKGAFYWQEVRVKSDKDRFELATLTDVYPTKKAKASAAGFPTQRVLTDA